MRPPWLAGAIVIGKAATSELGYRGFTRSLLHGVTANPWDLARTPGGSSGGAAAAVAAGVTPIALGADGGGSIRTPAAFTGLVGVKPGFGRVPVWPPSATRTLAHAGPPTRSVADAALVLGIVSGPDARDPTSLQPPLGPEPDTAAVRRMRVAFAPSLGYARVDPEIATVIEAALGALGAVWPAIETVAEVCPDPTPILVAEFIGGCGARLADAVERTPELIDAPLLDAILAFRATAADPYTRLLRQRLVHRETLLRFFERHDLLSTPTAPCAAWRLDHAAPPGFEDATVWSYVTYPFNPAGVPLEPRRAPLDAAQPGT